jgi:hypothetical protein
MAKAVVIASGTGDVQAFTGPCVLSGFAFRESAGTPAAAKFVLRDGTAATDEMRIPVNLNASESTRDLSIDGGRGIVCHNGIYVDRESGTTEGVVFIR